jgi:hypothetical protein
MFEVSSGGFEDGFQVLEDLNALFPGGITHQLAGGRVDRNLSGAEDQFRAGNLYRLRIWADSTRRFIGLDDISHAASLNSKEGIYAMRNGGQRKTGYPDGTELSRTGI